MEPVWMTSSVHFRRPMALELLLLGVLVLDAVHAALIPWPLGRGRALVSKLVEGAARAAPGSDTAPSDALVGPSPAKQPAEPIEASLSAVGLIQYWGYPAETHSIQTEDGYLLTLQRVPWGRLGPGAPGNDSGGPQSPRPVALLQHGFLQSSDQWLLRGPGMDLALIMADRGYDVWLGNFRGNFYSRRHAALSPDQEEFWDFSWHENGYYDLAASIDYALAVSGQPSLYYIGHSMGTTALLVLLATRPEYNGRVRAASMLAPVGYFTRPRGVLSVALPLYSSVETELRNVRLEVLPRFSVPRSLASGLCGQGSPTYNLCLSLYFQAAGVDQKQMNSTLFPVIVAHLPAGASLGQVTHYAQVYRSGVFRQFDRGSQKNLLLYGQPSPPRYDLSKVVAPIIFHYSSGDYLSRAEDVERLASEVPGTAGMYKVPLKDFNHGDYLWATDSYNLLYKGLLKILRQF